MQKGHYVMANGVKTYYEVHGEGEPLLLMHGGLCTVESLSGLVPELVQHFRVILPERRGHGRTADVEGPITYDLMIADKLAFMDALGIQSAHMVGYSDGANIGLLLAIERPSRVKTLVSISGNFDADCTDEQTRALMEVMTPEAFSRRLVRAYQEVSPDGPEHYPIVFEKVRQLWLREPKITPQELGRIEAPTLVMAGDRDFVRLDHTVTLFQSIPQAQLCVVPGTTHGLIWEKPKLVSRLVADFLLGIGGTK